jgi:branched-chain amino acid transport system permease protein
MHQFLDAVIRGVQAGSVYALVGLGINIIFGATGVFNFAQGDMVMVGAVLGVTLWTATGLPFPVAILLVMVVAAAIGATTEIVAVRGTARFKQATVLWVISTLGVSIIIEAVAAYLVERSGEHANGTIEFPSYVPWKSFNVGDLLIVPQRAIIFPIALVLTFAISLFFRRTLWGRALSAMAFDREAAAMRGIPVGWLAVVAFALGGAIAGIGGFAAGPITQASVNLGFTITLQGFIAATIGGIPKIWGPIIGGVILGLVVQFTTSYWDASFINVVSLVVLLVVLVIKPNGILGRATRTL